VVIKKKIEKSVIDSFVSKGGEVKSDLETKNSVARVTIRLPGKWLEKIDEAVEGRCGMNRNAWLLQAAQEKLERDGEK
jgi:hypothetical protein